MLFSLDDKPILQIVTQRKTDKKHGFWKKESK